MSRRLRYRPCPDGVKRVLVERKQPACCDLLIDDLIQAHGGPVMIDVAYRGEAVGERSDSVSVADDLKRTHRRYFEDLTDLLQPA